MIHLRTSLFISCLILFCAFSSNILAQPHAQTTTPTNPDFRDPGEDIGFADARTCGSWRFDKQNGLRLAPDAELRNSFFAPNRELSPYGVLRAAVKLGKRPDFSLFFRATFRKNVDVVDGYSVSVAKQTVDIHRWESGFAMPAAKSVKLPKNIDCIDIQADFRRPQAVIEIFGQSKKTQNSIAQSCNNIDYSSPIVRFVLDDSTWLGAHAGYSAYKKQDETTALLSWSFRPEIPDPSFPVRPPVALPQAYTRRHPASYIIATESFAADRPDIAAIIKSKCAPVVPSIIPKADIFRCNHDAMTVLIGNSPDRTLPDGLFWTEPRAAFANAEYRRFAKELSCSIPMQCDENAPLDPNKTAKDADMTQAYLDAYLRICSKRVKNARIETIGTTYLGHPMRAIVLSGAKPGRPVVRVLFNGSHHGMELLAADFAFDILEQICEPPDAQKQAFYASVLENVEIWVLPVVNLDGLDMYFHASDHLGRKNGRNVFIGKNPKTPLPKRYAYADESVYARYSPNNIAVGAGVDINRNYPLRWGATGEISSSDRERSYWHRGSAPASEPETQAMMHMFHSEQFAASISFHTVSTRILSPYSIDALRNPPKDKDPLRQLAQEMADNAGKQPNGKFYEVVKNIYSVDGTDQDWFRMMAGTAAYLAEGPLHNPIGEKRRAAVASTRPVWETLLRRAKTATVARVKSAEGAPLIARIEYSDIPALNDEIWLTRPKDGTHAMLCQKDRTVTVTLANGMQKKQTIPCRDGKITAADFVFDVSMQPGDAYDALCKFGFCQTEMYGVDALCDMDKGHAPRYPAQRYCIRDAQCLPAGFSVNFGPLGKWQCNPREKSRFGSVSR